VLRDPFTAKALRAVLHDEARRRRRAGLRRHQVLSLRRRKEPPNPQRCSALFPACLRGVQDGRRLHRRGADPISSEQHDPTVIAANRGRRCWARNARVRSSDRTPGMFHDTPAGGAHVRSACVRTRTSRSATPTASCRPARPASVGKDVVRYFWPSRKALKPSGKAETATLSGIWPPNTRNCSPAKRACCDPRPTQVSGRLSVESKANPIGLNEPRGRLRPMDSPRRISS